MEQKNDQKNIPLTSWDFTLKAPEMDNGEHYKEIMNILHTIASKYVYQLEQSESGYNHYQGRLRLIKKARLPQIKKLVKGTVLETMHLSPTTNGEHNNKSFSYVMKLDTRVSGPWSDQDYVSLKDEYIPVQYRIKEWRSWQQSLIDIFEVFDTRGIHVLVDPDGNNGKTTFALGLLCKKKAEYIPPLNDPKDIMRMVFDLPTSKTYIIDLTRSMNKDKLFGLYSAIEQIKNGYIYDDRYNFRRRLIDSPNILVMTNKEPDTGMLSLDRWIFHKIEDNKLVTYIPNTMALDAI